MPEIKIKGIPQELLDKIDSLTKLSKFHDRSAFLISVLNEYCLYHDNYFINSLPDTTKILVEESLKNGTKSIDNQLQLTLAVISKNSKIIEDFCNIIGAEDDD